eukprot:1972755-Amphidinium_carterae.1
MAATRIRSIDAQPKQPKAAPTNLPNIYKAVPAVPTKRVTPSMSLSTELKEKYEQEQADRQQRPAAQILQPPLQS